MPQKSGSQKRKEKRLGRREKQRVDSMSPSFSRNKVGLVHVVESSGTLACCCFYLYDSIDDDVK